MVKIHISDTLRNFAVIDCSGFSCYNNVNKCIWNNYFGEAQWKIILSEKHLKS